MWDLVYLCGMLCQYLVYLANEMGVCAILRLLQEKKLRGLVVFYMVKNHIRLMLTLVILAFTVTILWSPIRQLSHALGVQPRKLTTPAKVKFVTDKLQTIDSLLVLDAHASHGNPHPGYAYWGPFKERIRMRFDDEWGKFIDYKCAIDPFNHDGDPSEWKRVPRLDLKSHLITIEGLNYWYYSNGLSVYALISCGPDEDLDITRELLDDVGNAKRERDYDTALAQLKLITYDPTNGVLSNGDIISIRYVGPQWSSQ